MNKFKHIISKEYTSEEIVNILLNLTIVIMPFLFIPIGNSYTIECKTIFNYFVGCFILLLMIVNRIKISCKEMWISLAFIIALFISSVLSPYGWVAFLGNMKRSEGFFMLLMYVVFFWASIKYLKVSEKSILIWLIAANVMSIYGVLQYFGVDLVANLYGIPLRNVCDGFIGNRNFFSTYILIFLFISSSIYVFYRKKIYLFLSLPLFTALLCTLTRGGWVALLVFSVIGVCVVIKRKEYIKRIIIISVCFISIFSIMNIVSEGEMIGRGKTIIADIDNFGEMSGSGRVEIWKMGMKIISEKPILGTGPDTFHYASMDYATEEATKFITRTLSYADKSHNEFIEYAVSGGMVTLIIYISLIIYIIIKLIKRREDDNAVICILFILGYMVQSFFNISVLMVAPIFWIMMGICVKVGNGENLIEK